MPQRWRKKVITDGPHPKAAVESRCETQSYYADPDFQVRDGAKPGAPISQRWTRRHAPRGDGTDAYVMLEAPAKQERSDGNASAGVLLDLASYVADKLPSEDARASTLGVDYYFGSPSDASTSIADHGFILLSSVLHEDTCKAMLLRCASILESMLTIDTLHHGNRGFGRYSMGAAAASGQQLHHVEWASLLTDPVLDALDNIYGKDGYVLAGGGGEIVLGEVDEYQDLHADVSRMPFTCDTLHRPPVTVVNFCVHSVGEDHGPTRIWPKRGSPRDRERPMRQDAEPPAILRSTLAPMSMGCCVVRDARIWHGGTPNFRSYPRYLPNIEFFSREYWEHISAQNEAGRFNRRTMTLDVFQHLPPRAQSLAAHLVTTELVPAGITPKFVKPQGKVFRDQICKQLNALQVGELFTFTGNGFQCHQVRELCEARGMISQMKKAGPASTVTAQRTW